jgi:hypothetical protein
LTAAKKGAHMSKRTIGLAIIVLGALVSILSLVADQIGFGFAPSVVGWKQLTASNIGIFIALFGLWFSQAQPKG